ncbi:MAG: glycoside hydrolase family 2, partial [Thalassotalea sp.]|nr:glycoside hydrolase family 2 [Thalassotalea sp.]
MLSSNKIHAKAIVSNTINLNKGWEFKREKRLGNVVSNSESFSELNKESTTTKWQTVNLPHTPKIEPLLVNEQWQGVAWYQKTILVEPKWKNNKIFIRFEAAMNHAEVWLNDKKIGEHLGGYLPFTLD